MKIFESEIASETALERESQSRNITDSIAPIKAKFVAQKVELADNLSKDNLKFQQWIAGRQAEITAATDSLRARENNWVGEIEGMVGSGIKGYGPAAKAKREAIMQDSIRVEQLKAQLEIDKTASPEYLAYVDAQRFKDKREAEINTELKSVTDNEHKLTARIDGQEMDGFFFRADMLARIAKKSFMVWVVFGMFFVFEALTIIIKMMIGKDGYDEEAARVRLLFKTEQDNANSLAIQTSNKAHDDVYYPAQTQLVNARLDHVTNLKIKEDQISSTQAIRLNNITMHLNGMKQSIDQSVLDEDVRKILNMNMKKVAEEFSLSMNHN